jgi:hypothetical protein
MLWPEELLVVPGWAVIRVRTVYLFGTGPGRLLANL